ncbi:hypothetical protein STEG23_014675, partial [Scotinomys teguina]
TLFLLRVSSLFLESVTSTPTCEDNCDQCVFMTDLLGKTIPSSRNVGDKVWSIFTEYHELSLMLLILAILTEPPFSLSMPVIPLYFPVFCDYILMYENLESRIIFHIGIFIFIIQLSDGEYLGCFHYLTTVKTVAAKNRFYAKGRGFNNKNITCHTSSLSTPENEEQAQNTEANFVLKENVDAPAWSELSSLQSTNRNTRYFAFYNLFHCLRRDSNNVEMFLKLLKCRMVQSNC